MNVAIKKIWHDPVWSAVIAGSILVILTGVHFDWWSRAVIGNALRWTLTFLIASSPVYHWLLVLLGFVAAYFIFVLASALREAKQDALNTPPWLSYKTDLFYKIHWRWGYAPGGSITALACFCPCCEYQLCGTHDSFLTDEACEIIFHCDSCGYSATTLEVPSLLESKVLRLIQQKIRLGYDKGKKS